MLTLLFTQNLGLAGSPGGASVGAPVVTPGVPAPATSAGGGGVRHFGAGYSYDDPVVIAAREEVKILRKEKRKVLKEDTHGAMLDAIESRLKELYALLETKRTQHQRTIENFEYKAKMEREAVEKKRSKRQRRMATIMRLLDS